MTKQTQVLCVCSHTSSVDDPLEGSEKSGLMSGQIMGSTLLSKFACLGNHPPSFFGTSAWIPPQKNDEQVSTGKVGVKASRHYQSVILLQNMPSAPNMMSSKGCCSVPSQANTLCLMASDITCKWNTWWKLFGPFQSCFPCLMGDACKQVW